MIYKIIAYVLMILLPMVQNQTTNQLKRWPVFNTESAIDMGIISVDTSKTDEGYIIIKEDEGIPENTIITLKPIKVKNAKEISYRIQTDRTYDVLPFLYGNGKYEIQLKRPNDNHNSTKDKLKTIVHVHKTSDYSEFLVPTHYVWYTPESTVTKEALAITHGKTMTDKEICAAVHIYMKKNFHYDNVRAIKIIQDKNIFVVNHINMYQPILEEPFKTKMGVCMDIASIMAAMLRINGIPAMLTVGYADGKCHAWVTAVVDGQEVIYDPTADISETHVKKYTEFQRY